MILLGQVVLSFVHAGEGPLRLGFPLPAATLRRGLRVDGAGARLQWRPLVARADPETGRVWVELAITGASRRVRVRAGGVGPCGEAGGDVVVVERRRVPGAGARRWLERWTWSTGEVDERRREVAGGDRTGDGELRPGEAITTVSARWSSRWLDARIASGWWRRAGVLPGKGTLGRPYRERLVRLAATLEELPGRRGRGDYGRSKGIVTNLEYDTTLALARLGLAEGRYDLLERAARAARHLVDVDLDPASGLPHPHGRDHRARAPRPGHCWLRGVLLVGLLAADRELIRAAGGIARGLAARRGPPREGVADRARDLAWPLWEMEAWLRVADDEVVRRAADRLGAEILRRFDPGRSVVVFGEGRTRSGVYHERLWITAGVLLPALRAHQRRRRDPRLATVVRALERRVLRAVRRGRGGLPLHQWVGFGRVLGEARVTGRAEAFFLLEGLPVAELAPVLRRAQVQAALRDTPERDDPDLATAFSLAGRCAWILR